jgi:TonB family protein
MRDRNKNKKSSLNDFISYHDDKMQGEERNTFERELQKDLFSKEASEGFASVTSHEASGDMHDLRERLENRVSRKKRFIIYRIAATIAILMLISSVFIIIQIKKPSEHIAMKNSQQRPFEIAESLPITGPATNGEPPSVPTVVQEPIKEIRTEKADEPEAVEAFNAVINDEIAVSKNSDSMSELKLKREDIYSRKAQISAAPAAAMGKSYAGPRVTGKVISSDDNLPIPGVTIVVKGMSRGVMTDSEGNFSIALPDSDNQTLVASFIGMGTKEFEVKQDTPALIKLDPDLATLNEIVVTGYGAGRAESENDRKSGEYLYPKPSGGKDKFDSYIRENIRWPDTSAAHHKVVVVLGFTVRTDGSLDSIKIIRSPGKAFSDEAIRLVRSGPAWNPAEDGGRPVEDEVRLRIVFK